MKTSKFRKISLTYTITLWLLMVVSMFVMVNILTCIIYAIIFGIVLIILHKHFVKKFNNAVIEDAYIFTKQIQDNRMCHPDLIKELVDEIKKIK